MRAGLLKDRITVEEQPLVGDGQGGREEGDWTAISGMERIPAQVRALSGSEAVTAMQVQSAVTHEVLIRYRTGVKASMRIIYHAKGGDMVLNIITAPVIEGINEGLRFMARQSAD